MSYYKGLAFSLTLNETGMFSRKTDENLIKDSVKQIVLSGKGSRVMRRRYGCGIANSLFEGLDEFAGGIASDSISDALGEFEKRISINEVSVETDENFALADILVSYTFNGSIDKTNVPIE